VSLKKKRRAAGRRRLRCPVPSLVARVSWCRSGPESVGNLRKVRAFHQQKWWFYVILKHFKHQKEGWKNMI
jgi:hypothetical protein